MTATLPAGVLDAVRRLEAAGADPERVRDRLASAGLIADPMAEERARLRLEGPHALGEAYLPASFYGSRSPLHDHLNAWHVAEAGRPPGARHAVAAPRGHGKSTAGVEVAALWHAANCTRRFQVIVSDTFTQARERIQAIKAAAETNEGLIALYPKLRPAYAYGEPGTWRENDLVFACGCRVVGFGAGTAIRGLKHRDARPSLLYLDDLEDEDSVSTPYQIEKRQRWLLRTALALGGQGRRDGAKVDLSALWVGTILSRDALLNLATGAAVEKDQSRPSWARTWSSAVYRAELEDTPEEEVTVEVDDTVTGGVFTYSRRVRAPMWADLTREDLALVAGRIGADAYAAEYMADPVDRQGGVLAAPMPAEWVNASAPVQQRLIRFTPEGGTPRVLPVALLTRAAALDPQFADEGASDPDLAAVAVVGQHGPWTFILDSWIGRDRHGQAATLVRMALAWGCQVGGVESNGAQVLVADQAAQYSRLAIHPEPSTEGKAQRALGMMVRLQQRRVFILPGGNNDELPGYLTAFPNGRYDDPVDAVVMATNIATRMTPLGTSAPGTGVSAPGPIAGGGRLAGPPA